MIDFRTTKDLASERSGTHQNNLACISLRYVEKGWSVIPVTDKRPAIGSWKAYQHRTPRSHELDLWFNRAQKPSGIGIVTGRISNLVVVDCDTAADSDYWLSQYPCSSAIVRTGGGGVHVYYQMPRDVEIRNRAGVLARKIDIRAEGGYVVAPPSHHSSGSEYQWIVSEPTLSNTLPLFNPAWIDSPSQLNDMTLPAVKPIRDVVNYIMRIRAISGSKGHNSTFRAACKLRDAGISQIEARKILLHWNLTNAEPPWSDAEILHKIASAYSNQQRTDH